MMDRSLKAFTSLRAPEGGRIVSPSGRRAILLAGLAGLARPAVGRDAGRTLKFAVDAEFGHPTSTSAQAIALGCRVAIAAINDELPRDFPRLEMVTSDNAGVAAIAQDNFVELAADPDVIGVFGGKFSPVQMEVVPLAHRHRLMLLNPWGSADGITEHGFRPSWTFRLSLKDEWAAPAFVTHAREAWGAERIGLLLPTTAWGRSNQRALDSAAAQQGVAVSGIRWYSWGERSLARRYLELREAGAQVIVFVANEQEGSLLVRDMAALPAELRLPVLSHWGITGGRFPDLCGGALRGVNLSVIQTFSFHGNRRPQALALRAATEAMMPAGSRLEAAVGIAQAHDLMRIVGLAVQQAGSLGRGAIRDAMERVPAFDGAVADYRPPFTPDRHDADLSRHIFFARYNEDGALVPVA